MKAPKRIMTINDLNAYKLAYGNPLEKKELLSSLIKAFFVGFVASYALYHFFWMGVIIGAVSSIYSYIRILPQSIKRNYEAAAFRERNAFLNNMTQILTNPNRTVLEAIEIVTERSNGEFQQDILQLQADLIDAHNENVQEAFTKLINKYSKDVIFTMYIEQLITAVLEGRTSMEAFKDIKMWHNETKKIQDQFYANKYRRAYEFKFICWIILALIGAITISFGWTQFINLYAHKPIGWVFSFIFLFIVGIIFHKFISYMGDDSIMEVKV